MRMTGQYRTEKELREEIANLEQIAKCGEITLPKARALSDARAELDQICAATNPYHRPWPLFDR